MSSPENINESAGNINEGDLRSPAQPQAESTGRQRPQDDPDSEWLRAQEETAELRRELELARLRTDREIEQMARDLEETRIRKEEELAKLRAREELAEMRAQDREARLREREELARDRRRYVRRRRPDEGYRDEPARYRDEPARYRDEPTRYRDEPTRYRDEPTRYRDEPARYRQVGPEPEPVGGDLTERLVDEASRVVRGLSAAYATQVRLAADVAESLASIVVDQSRQTAAEVAQPRRSGRTRTRQQVGDRTYRGTSTRGRSADVRNVLDRALELPERAIDEFYQAYRRET